MKSKTRLHHLTKSAGAAPNAVGQRAISEGTTSPMSRDSRVLLEKLASIAGVSPLFAMEVIVESVLAQAAEDTEAIETLHYLITNPSLIHA